MPPKQTSDPIILRKNDTTTPRRPTRASSGDRRAAGPARVRMQTLPSHEKYYRPTRARALRRQAELLDFCWWALVLLMGAAVAAGLWLLALSAHEPGRYGLDLLISLLPVAIGVPCSFHTLEWLARPA